MMKTEPPNSPKVLAAEMDDFDPEALAGEVIDSWLEALVGQQFNLFDRDQC